tara:strand:- start:484 stop:942 length:459 start_codon:yes stop_codon:yes gene_type:complete
MQLRQLLRVCLIAALLPVHAAFSLVPRPRSRTGGEAKQGVRAAAASEEQLDGCALDEPKVECMVRQQVDGPWADVWAKYVLLRPGMRFGELKAATLKRNELDPSKRIPGTFRTVVLVHAVCFLAAIPMVLQNENVFPKLVNAAVGSLLKVHW